MTKKEVTNEDLMKMLGEFAGNVHHEFGGVQQQFERIDVRLDGIDLRIDQLETRLEGKIDKVASSIDQVQRSLDRSAAMLETDETERLVLSAQVDRHEDWIIQSADAKTVRPYSPGA